MKQMGASLQALHLFVSAVMLTKQEHPTIARSEVLNSFINECPTEVTGFICLEGRHSTTLACLETQ